MWKATIGSMAAAPVALAGMRSAASSRARIAWVTGLLLAGPVSEAVPLAAGMKLGIDFGPTLTANWNNITTNNQAIAAGSVTNLSGAVLDGIAIATANSQFVNNDGSNAWPGLSTNGGTAPPEFVESVVTDIAGNFSLGDATPYRITITGLNPALVFRVDAVATATGSPSDTFTILGAATYGPSAITRANARTGQFHTFTGVQANSSGTLVIEVSDSAASTNPIVCGILLSAASAGVPDSDGDGLTDAWELTHFGGLGQGPAGDYDQDGDTNLTEFQEGTLPASIASNSGAVKAWQIDFQGGPGGAFGSVDPVTAAQNLGYGPKWNAFVVPATNAEVFANPPTNHNAVQDPVLANLADGNNAATPATLSINGGVSAFNVGRILTNGGIDHAFGDHWFWGAQGLTSATLGFTFSNLPPGTYSLTAYANPDQHNPPRDFGMTVGPESTAIVPVHGATFYANPGTFAGTIRGITVDGSGNLSGSLTTIAGDPSIAAMVLRQVGAPTSAYAAADAVTMNHGGKWKFDPLANDVVFPPLVSVEIVQAPASGTAVVQADRDILYTHTGGTPLSDSFRYRFTDATGQSNEAQVTVTFTGDIRVSPATVDFPPALPLTTLTTEDAFAGRGSFNFEQPTWMTTIEGNNERFFVAEKDGIVWEIPDMGASPVTRRVFMDFTSPAWKAAQGGQLDFFTEMGIKAFALHPDFESGKPYVYVSYNFEAGSANNGAVGTVRLSRFTATGPGLASVDMLSELVMIEIDSASQDHNIDGVKFGPDGYLYLGFGDERNPGGNSQTITNELWSSIIRIDVDRLPGNLEPNPAAFVKTSGGVAHYKIPADNPYAATSGMVSYNGTAFAWDAVRSEIYVTGARNPWQFSFDSIDGEPVIWHGDIGSDGSSSREEVNILRKGDNAGWRIREGGGGLQAYTRGDGTVINGPLTGTAYTAPPPGVTLRDPEWFYERGGGNYQGASVTGGFVYRGAKYPSLDGKYVFGDWLNGHLWSLERGASPGNPTVNRIGGIPGVVGFHQDPSNGDILILSWNSEGGGLFASDGQIGKVFRLKSNTVGPDTFPAKLSETGLFADLTDLTPNPGVLPYEPNVTFWSDHAKKRRWFALPEGQFGFDPDDTWTFPEGALWVKHFDMELRSGDPASRKRLETRVLVKNAGGVYGVSYRWNEAGTEADLVGPGGVSFNLAIDDDNNPATPDVTRPWLIPSHTQCITCHNPGAGHVLGFDTRQLNHARTPLAGQSGNYLELLESAGYLGTLPSGAASLPAHVDIHDPNANLEARVRAYLDVNCAYCHEDSSFNLRASVPLELTGLLHIPDGGQITHPDPAVRRVLPGNPALSSVLQRTAGAPLFNRMPPLASNVIDAEGVALLTDWIEDYVNSAPAFALGTGPNVVVIDSNSPPGTPVVLATAADPDAPRDSVVHSIVSGNEAGHFAIDPASGQVTLVSAPSVPSFTLVIRATDNFAANPRAAEATFNIVFGTNTPPAFHGPADFFPLVSLPSGSRVGSALARDAQSGSVTYTLTGGSGTGFYGVNPATGEITVTGTPVAGAAYALEVQASDGNLPASRTFTIRPVAAESTALAAESGRVFWNIDFQGDGSSTAAGQTTAPVTTTDGGMFWNAFQVKAYTGSPSAASANPWMALKTQGGGAVTPVTFSFQTDNDPATPVGSGIFGYSGRTTTPSLTGDYLLLLNQTVEPNNATVHRWQIGGLVPGWQYDLLFQGGYDGAGRGMAVTVDRDGDASLGDESPVNVNHVADRVANSAMFRSVFADAAGIIRGTTGRTPPAGTVWGESNWAGLQVRAAGNTGPVITGPAAIQVAENSPATTLLGTWSGIDTEAHAFTWSLSGGGGIFAIHPSNGELRLLAPPDHESAASHLLTITATDNGSPAATSTAGVTVSILDVIENNGERVTAALTAPGGPFPGSTDPALTGFNADPNRNGLANALDLLFGIDPAQGGGQPVMRVLTAGRTHAAFEVEVDAAMADLLAFHFEVSDALGGWAPCANAPVVVSESGAVRTLRVTDSEELSSKPGRYFRIRIEAGDF